jgi:single-stranded DNA-specific DHH superfamily exonuclease
LFVDTKILPQEWTNWNFKFLEKFEPFGECNEEPLFLFENLQIQKVEKVWKNGSSHMKLYAHRWDKLLNLIFWWKGSQSDLISSDISVIWKIKRDTFNWWYFVDWCAVIEDWKIIDF